MKIKIPFIQLEDLGLLDSLIREFQADDNGIIDLSKYCQSVYILPRYLFIILKIFGFLHINDIFCKYN